MLDNFDVLILLFAPFAILAAILFVALRKFRASEEDERLSFPRLFPWVLLIAVVGFNFFAYDVPAGIGIGLFITTLAFAIVLSFDRARQGTLVYFLAGTASVAGLLLGGRANEFILEVNMCTALLCLGALLMAHALKEIRWNALWLAKMNMFSLPESIRHLPNIWKSATSMRRSEHPIMVSILKTFLLTVIPLLFFAYLLSAADPVFDKMIEHIREQALERTLWSIVIAGIGTYFLTLRFRKEIQESTPTLSRLSFVNVIVPTLSLLLLFALFLFIQAKYLFGSHADFLQIGITYSNYVRQGFQELLVASFAGSVLAYFLIIKQRELTDAPKASGLKVATAVLILELALLLASALKRDVMYMEMYGLTRVRIIGLLFLAWIAGILLLLLFFTVWRRMLEKLLLSGILFLSAVTVLTLNLLNIDAMIARATPPRGQTKDFIYINMLSADALDGWRESIGSASSVYENVRLKKFLTQEEEKQLAEAKISMHAFIDRRSEIISLHDYFISKWQTFNASILRAHRAFQTEKNLFFTLPDCLIAEIEDYQVINNIVLVTEERDRFENYEYPFIQSMHYYPKTLESMVMLRRETNRPGQNSADSCTNSSRTPQS